MGEYFIASLNDVKQKKKKNEAIFEVGGAWVKVEGKGGLWKGGRWKVGGGIFLRKINDRRDGLNEEKRIEL